MEKLIEKQNTEYFKLRDQLSANVSPEILKSILKVNKQAIPDDLSEVNIKYIDAFSCLACNSD